MQVPIHLSVVIPAYNEERRITKALCKLSAYLMCRAYRSEIIVVSNGSTDHTADLVRQWVRQNLVRPVEPWLYETDQAAKGAACRIGIQAARGKYIYLCDADLAVDTTQIASYRLLAENSGADLVLGDRSGCTMSPLRRLSSLTFHAITRDLCHVPDTQCGFKLLRRETVAPLLAHSVVDGFGWDVELIHLAEIHRLQIRSLPVRWVNDPDSRVRLVRDSLRMIGEVNRIRQTHRRCNENIPALTIE